MTDWIPQTNLAAVHSRELVANVQQRMFTVAQRGAFIDGPEVEQFEEKWADYVGAKHCVAVANGTDALELAVRAVWGPTKVDTLYLPAFTFVATAEAVVRAGENMALVDVDPVTLLVDEVDLAVGLYGQMPRLFGPLCVVDAAQMHGHQLLDVTAAWSFYPTKNLGCWGDGGAVTTDDEGLAEGIREWARHGGRGRVGPGFNSRMDTVQACVLIEKLPFLDQWVEERRQVAGSYRRRLRGMGLDVIGDVSSVWHQCVVRVPHRDAVQDAMERRGVGTGVHYERALSEMAWLEPYRADVVQGMSCVEAERAAREVLSLPIWPSMPISIIDRVVNVLGESIEQAKREAE